ncbi:hypothetical protein [Thermoflexus sp.]|uniref:hypothetical protein n=1 Tax=Thermoflexus sp. TaxID=1969742 RepID=UPI00262436B7|nr:hypothetical protein [Thermoflexus sp.]MCX7690393.1 hypothetical protein [Thermoflexus sp.]
MQIKGDGLTGGVIRQQADQKAGPFHLALVFLRAEGTTQPDQVEIGLVQFGPEGMGHHFGRVDLGQRPHLRPADADDG